MSTAPARRGRRPAGEDTRGLIVEAARTEFAERGYDATSVRAVARLAGVDPALVHHYFDGKADLFAQAVVVTDVNPAAVVARVVAGPVEGIGERMVRAFLTVWDDPAHQERLVALVRTAFTNDALTTTLREFLAREVVGRVTARTGVADPALRGGLVVSQLVGLAVTRYVLRVPGVADASVDELALHLGPTLQRYLTDP